VGDCWHNGIQVSFIGHYLADNCLFMAATEALSGKLQLHIYRNPIEKQNVLDRSITFPLLPLIILGIVLEIPTCFGLECTRHNNSFLSLLTIQNIFSINISNKSSPPKPFHSKIPLNCNQQQQLRLQYTDCKVLNIAAADVDGWTEYFTTI